MTFVSKRAFRASVFPLLLAVVGCADEPGRMDESVNVTFTPRAQCEALASALCNREAECARPIQGFFDGPADEQAYVDECERINQRECFDVVAVATSFNVCLNAVPRAGCVLGVSSSTGFDPSVEVPNSCEDVLFTD